MPSLGGLASTLYQMGQQAREDQLRKISENKMMQDRHIQLLEHLYQDPTVDPEAKPEIFGEMMNTSNTSPEKFDSGKAGKFFGNLTQRQTEKHIAGNQQADAESAANPQERQGTQQQMPDLQALLSSAVPDASGQMPAGAAPIPPMSGGAPLPAYQFPERSQREATNLAPFFDPTRPMMAMLQNIDRIMKTTGLNQVQASDLVSGHPIRDAVRPPDNKDWQLITEGAIDPQNPDAGPQIAFYNKTNPGEMLYRGPLVRKPGAADKPEILYDKDGNAIGYRDDKNRILSPTSPDLPPEVKKVIESAKPKTPTLPEGERPLRNVEAYNNAFQRRWQAANHKGQPLPPEYTLAPDATQKDFDRISGLLEKEEQAISTKQRNDESAADRAERLAALEAQRSLVREDRSYTETNRGIDSLEKPVADLNGRMGRLVDTIGQGNIVADALIAPEVLSIIAGGQGSGLRMTDAEISRVVGGRTHWADLKAAASKWTDQTTARSITPEQADQIKALVAVVNQKIQAKLALIQSERAELAQATNPQEHRKIAARLRKSLEDVDAGKQVAAPLGAATPPPNPPAGGAPKRKVWNGTAFVDK